MGGESITTAVLIAIIADVSVYYYSNTPLSGQDAFLEKRVLSEAALKGAIYYTIAYVEMCS